MFFVNLVRRLLYLAVIFGLIHVWLSRKSYTFDHANLTAIAKRHSLPASAGGTATVNEIRDSFKAIVKELRQFYGPFVLPDADLKWIKTSHGGGGAIAFCPIHFSLTEYVTLIGSALPSTAHCGRSWTNITIIPVAGSVDVWLERYTTSSFTPGQPATLFAGDSCIIHYHKGFWALEYGRGFTPASMPHAIGGVLFQNQDPMILLNLGDAFLKTMLRQFEFVFVHWREIFKF